MARLDAESDEEKETKDIAGPQPDFTELMARELTARKLIGFPTGPSHAVLKQRGSTFPSEYASRDSSPGAQTQRGQGASAPLRRASSRVLVSRGKLPDPFTAQAKTLLKEERRYLSTLQIIQQLLTPLLKDEERRLGIKVRLGESSAAEPFVL